jgi:Cu-Zn family superoxide dismutase
MFRAVIFALLAATACFFSACSSIVPSDAPADIPSATATVSVNLTGATELGQSIGTINLQDTQYGLLLMPNLMSLKPGIHGFHIHTNPDCQAAEKDGKPVPGLAAGGHYDPSNTKTHLGPYKNGHLGDLPPLAVTDNGKATLPVLAPRIKVADLKDRSLMIHAGGDNYSDQPQPLGGGGARVACGIVS